MSALLLLAATVVAVAAVRARRRARRAVDPRAAADLPELVETFVALVRAGSSPAEAVRRAGAHAPPPLQPTLVQVVARLDQGHRLADALAELSTAVPAAHAVVDILATADRYGLPIAPVLDRLADEARAQRRRAAEAAARQLPVRLAFPLVCCTLPSFGVLTVVPIVVASLGSLPSAGP